MHDKHGSKTETFPLPLLSDAMKDMSDKEFAALGAEKIVFKRRISAEALSKFVPQAVDMPQDLKFLLLMSADGSPVLVTDSDEAIANWLEEHDVALVERH